MLLKSGLDTGTAAAFLHENMLEFVDHNAVEDAAGACAYLSDAGLLRCSFPVAHLSCRPRRATVCASVPQCCWPQCVLIELLRTFTDCRISMLQAGHGMCLSASMHLLCIAHTLPVGQSNRGLQYWRASELFSHVICPSSSFNIP